MTTLVVGIGNGDRGDDAIGPLVAERVAGLGLPGVEVVVRDEPLSLVEHLVGREDVVVVDAARAGSGPPGTVHVLRVGPAPLRAGVPAVGSHGLGVLEALELARALDRLPPRLTLVGVEVGDVAFGAPLSVQVRDRLEEAVRAVVDLLPGGAGVP